MLIFVSKMLISMIIVYSMLVFVFDNVDFEKYRTPLEKCWSWYYFGIEKNGFLKNLTIESGLDLENVDLCFEHSDIDIVLDLENTDNRIGLNLEIIGLRLENVDLLKMLISKNIGGFWHSASSENVDVTKCWTIFRKCWSNLKISVLVLISKNLVSV